MLASWQRANACNQPLPPQGALCDDDAGVRTAAGGVFNVLFKSGGGSAMDSVIPALLGGLDSEAHSAQVSEVLHLWRGPGVACSAEGSAVDSLMPALPSVCTDPWPAAVR